MGGGRGQDRGEQWGKMRTMVTTIIKFKNRKKIMAVPLGDKY